MPEPRILMNPGPRFEEICALYLYQMKTGWPVEILFRDWHGDPGPAVPDIDVRRPYSKGSSAFEQICLQLDCANEYSELIQVFNQDNQDGFLNRNPFRNSFIWLIPRLFDMAPEEPSAKQEHRRFIIAECQELVEVIFWAYTNPALMNFLPGLLNPKSGMLRKWPQRMNFVRNWRDLADAFPSPLTLAGYAYMRFLREEKPQLINQGLAKWRRAFAQVDQEMVRVCERLSQEKPELYRARDLWLAYLPVKHNFDSRAFFQTFKTVQLLVAYDARGRVPQAVIQARHGVDLSPLMVTLYLALSEIEPDCWHLDQRAVPGPTGTLLNGGRNRFRERSSELAADPQKIFSLINQCY